MDELFDPVREAIRLAKDIIDVCTFMDALEQTCDEPIVRMAIRKNHDKIHTIEASAMEYIVIIGDMIHGTNHPISPNERNN